MLEITKQTIFDICDCCEDLKYITYNDAEDSWHCNDCKTQYVVID